VEPFGGAMAIFVRGKMLGSGLSAVICMSLQLTPLSLLIVDIFEINV